MQQGIVWSDKEFIVIRISHPQEEKDEKAVISLWILILFQARLRVLENFLHGRLGLTIVLNHIKIHSRC